jgi:large repetitive protein
MRQLILALLLSAAAPTFAALTGTVMNMDGQPVAGARVTIHAYESEQARRERLFSAAPERTSLAAVETDSKGTFTIESPELPVVLLAVSAPGYVPVARMVERDEFAGVIPLTAAPLKQGTVRAGGKPLADAIVVARFGAFESIVRTNDKGQYAVPESRTLSLFLVHPDYAAEQSVQQQMTPAMPSLNLTLVPKITVQGRVVAENGAPVAGARVHADEWPVATTGEEGTFTAKVPSSWRTVSARSGTSFGSHPRGKETSLTLRLTPLTTISGRITDVGTGSAIAGAIVNAGPTRPGSVGSLHSGQTDAKGAFSLSVPAGSYTITAAHPSYEMVFQPVATAPGQKTSRDLSLTQYARVSGTVMDENRRPVAAAVIDAQDAGDALAMMGRIRRPGQFAELTVSGPDGRFVARVSPDSDLALRAMKKGFPFAKSDTLRLAPGERKGGLALTIPTGIEVTGKVVNSEGKPLSGVSVSAAEAETSGRGMIMRTVIMIGTPSRDDDVVRTASDGTFSMRLKEGTHDFSFQHDGYAPKSVRGQVVSATQPLNVETFLDPAVEISGRVTRSGSGIENVRVSAFSTGISQTSSSVTTGPDGSFTITGLAPGSVFLDIRKEEEFIGERRNVTAPQRDYNIEIAPGGTVTGRVIDKASRKPVTTFQAGISTSGSGGGMMRMGPPQVRDFNSEDGTFRLDHVPAGATVLVASAAGYTSGRMNISVEEGKTLANVEMELDTGVKLTGRVTGPTGGGLGEVQVSVVPSATGGFGAGGMMTRTSTDSNGEYSIEALNPGEETIAFSHPRYVSTRKTVTLKGRESRLDVQLSSGFRVTGVVVTESGAPVAEATVSISGNQRQALTNANGAFEMDNVGEGRHRFVATKSGFATGTLNDVDVSSGAPVRITLPTGSSIFGRVSGLSADELSVTVVDARGSQGSASSSVDAQGNYRIEGAPSGTVQVGASVVTRTVGRKSSSMKTIDLAPGGSQQVDIEFRGDITIRGRVMRNGAPLRGGSIMFSGRGGPQPTSSATIDDQGGYTVTGLEPGEYFVQVMDMQRFSPHATDYVVRGSAIFNIDYRTSSLRGRVLDAATNEPLDSVSIQLRPVTTAADNFRLMARSAVTDSGGTFVVDDVAPGNYTATASRDGYGNYVSDLRITERGDSVEMKLSRNDGVLLKFVDARDGRTISGSAIVFDPQGRIAFDSRSPMMWGGSDSDLRLPLAPGSYTATVTAAGMAPRTVSLTSPSNQTIPLSPGGTLLVVSRHQQPRRIRLIESSGYAYPRTSPNPGYRQLLPNPGTTTIQNIAAGSYTLQLLGDNDVVLDSKQVVIAEGQTSTTEI